MCYFSRDIQYSALSKHSISESLTLSVPGLLDKQIKQQLVKLSSQTSIQIFLPSVNMKNNII